MSEITENERFRLSEYQRINSQHEMESFLDNLWNNMSIPNKQIILFGDTGEAEVRFMESDYYEDE